MARDSISASLKVPNRKRDSSWIELWDRFVRQLYPVSNMGIYSWEDFQGETVQM